MKVDLIIKNTLFLSVISFIQRHEKATRDLGELAMVGAILAEDSGGAATRYRLNISGYEPIDPLNDPLKPSLEERLLRVVGRQPGVQLPFVASVEASVSRVTVKRAVAALVKAGKIEHRGSKKTGGYFRLPSAKE